MKLCTPALTLLAAPFLAAAWCKLEMQQMGSWDESGRRYRVEMRAHGDIDRYRATEDFGYEYGGE